MDFPLWFQVVMRWDTMDTAFSSKTDEEFINGFGDPSDPNGIYWIGVENLHQLTTSSVYNLYFSGSFIVVNETYLYENVRVLSREQGYAFRATSHTLLDDAYYDLMDADNTEFYRCDQHPWWHSSGSAPCFDLTELYRLPVVATLQLIGKEILASFTPCLHHQLVIMSLTLFIFSITA